MNIEVICPQGVGRGTQVFCDGTEMLGITHLTIEIPAGGPVKITINRQLLDEGHPLLREMKGGERDGERVVACETLRFSGGEFVLTEQSIDE